MTTESPETAPVPGGPSENAVGADATRSANAGVELLAKPRPHANPDDTVRQTLNLLIRSPGPHVKVCSEIHAKCVVFAGTPLVRPRRAVDSPPASFGWVLFTCFLFC